MTSAISLGVGRLVLDLGDAKGGQQLLNNTLGIEEVQLGLLDVPSVVVPCARKHTRHVRGLLGKALVLAAIEHAANLVEVHVGHAMVLVEGNGAQKARQ